MTAGRRWRKPVITVAVAASVVLALAATALWAGNQVRSPAQTAADALPPEPSLVLVEVERRLLAEPVVMRGKVTPGPSAKVFPPAAAVGPDSVVTAVGVRKGETLDNGQVLVVRAGVPLFGLVLPFPLYRDLAGGLSGPDVAELQRALRRLGYRVTATGTFDKATQRAIGRFFDDRGHRAPSGGAEATAQLTAARTALTQARVAYERASSAKSGMAAAKATLDQAQVAVAHAELLAGATLPRATVVRLVKAGGKVTAVRVKVGSVLDASDAPLLEVDGEAAYVAATVANEQAGFVRVGLEGTVLDESTGERADVVVSSVGGGGNADDKSGVSGLPVRLRFVGAPMAPAGDRSVRVAVSAPTGNGQVLAVPVTAVYSRPDGSTFVTIVGAGGRTSDVTVVTGQIAGGWVEVRPEHSGTLTEGDRVAVSEAATAPLAETK